MRYLPFVVAGDLEPRPVLCGEIIYTKTGAYFYYTERGWMPKDMSDQKTPLDPSLGLRYNSDKVKFGLIPGHWTRVLAQILTVGAKKYAPRNWEKGLVHSEIVDSLFRHLDSFLKGERYDPETKCHHLGHVAWNALALMTMDLKGIGKADLPKDDDVKTMET